jgi:hypothetical protein
MPIVKCWSIVGSCRVATLVVTSHTALAQSQRSRTPAAVTSKKPRTDLRPLLALLRLALTKEKLTRDMPIAWEFSGDLANDD